ncbi:S66 family peptidase [Maricaulis maris]|uniref:S66 family peptidase n=1 Tax=Maricaulis maris TaxID=74318 RepID=UPI003B8B88A8
MINYPAPLGKNSRIALTAFSAGVPDAVHPRLDLAIEDMRQRGFEIVEGRCLRRSHKHVSAPAAERAEEFMRFALDDTVDALAPPWGGELTMELLDLLDFDRLREARPKWIFGFSDVSTLSAVITAKCHWATAHCANFIDLIAAQTDPLTARTLDGLTLRRGECFTQSSSKRYQAAAVSFEEKPAAPLDLSEPTRWKRLVSAADEPSNEGGAPSMMEGRLLGGCLDTLGHLFNGPCLDLPGFAAAHGDHRCLLYFENVELSPTQLARTLLGMKYRGVFDDLAGILIGRNAGPERDGAGLTYSDVLESVLGGVGCPVLYDLDIGHKPPNLTLLNGSVATVRFEDGQGSIQQSLT